ncbi:MAG TPA: histidine kinase [Xanthomonadaceae bacterium]|jgi:signal transduction histidine kinase|nr:histidine kinase [Xanthomonadaceae bacterium]
MTLRRQLLLLALIALVLPWAAWQALVQMESLLRQGQQQALEASAEALARSLALRPALLPPAQPALRLHELTTAPRLDGDLVDWGAIAQPLEADAGAPALRFAIAHYNDRRLIAIAVDDTTPVRGEAHWPGELAIDAVVIELDTSLGSMPLKVAARADGPIRAAAPDGSAAAVLAEGGWRVTPRGYAIELALPQGLTVTALRLTQRDADASGGVRAAATARFRLYRAAPGLPGELAALLPADVKAVVVDARGWTLARHGALRADAADDVLSWRRVLYRWMLDAATREVFVPDASALRDDRPERLAASEGDAGSRWRRDAQGTRLILSSAVPVRVDGEVRAVLLLERSNAEALLLADRAAAHLLGLTLLAFLASGGVAFLFATRLSQRIRRLRDAAEQALDRSGEVRRFDVSTAGDEIGDLSRSFSSLLDEIAAYTRYLRSLASTLSHELQTPLAIVRSSLDNLDLEALPADARPYLARARDGVERMGLLVRTMSEATRIEHAISAAEHEAFDLARLLADVGEGYRDVLAPRRLRIDGVDSPCPYTGAPELLVQALDKLIDNARGFTPEDGAVGIALKRSGRELLIEVSNTGPSLPEAMRHRLFDSLVSMRERPRGTDGAVHLGFGLNVVRLVAMAHGGSAEADNLADGSGVVFRLRLALR